MILSSSMAYASTLRLRLREIRRIADRHFGVGCDQILLVEKAMLPDVDFRYRIFNADGGEVEQCGNGARCFVHFVRAKGLTTKRTIRVETRGGVIEPALEEDGQVTVDMGAPRFAAAEIPFVSDSDAVLQPLDVDGRPWRSPPFPWVTHTRFRLSPTSTLRRFAAKDR